MDMREKMMQSIGMGECVKENDQSDIESICHDSRRRGPDDGDLTEMLNELRILLPGSQMLTSFLIVLPFSGGFRIIVHAEKLVFFATFIFGLMSLVLFSAPAIQHRLMRPLTDRARFKHIATREIVAGSVMLSLALVLATNLVISEVFGAYVGTATSMILTLFVAAVWWLYPWLLKKAKQC